MTAPTFTIETRRNVGRCVFCVYPALRVVVTSEVTWRGARRRRVRRARRVCRACIDNIKRAAIP